MSSSAGVRDKTGILGPGTRTLRGGPDLSQLKTPIHTSLSGTRQVIHALECGTGEVKEYLLDEINLMYECRTCLSVFRSVANLVSHKRTFCRSRYKNVQHVYPGRGDQHPDDVQTVIVEAEPVECVVEEQEDSLENYAPSVELLKTSGILQDITNKPSINRLLPPGKPGLGQIVNKLRAKLDNKDEQYFSNHQRVTPLPLASVPSDQEAQIVHLEPMYETDSGLMQSWRYSEEGETVGETYRAWQEAEADKRCYKVWPNGKVTSSQETIKLVNGPDGDIYSVRVPIDAFASIDDIDTDDEEQGYTKYPCPTCKKTYSKIMNVFQHMVKVHDIEMHEAKAKRKIIQNQSVYVEGSRRKTKSKEYFDRPVKPVLVKLKNFTLNSKVPVNLCDKLRQPWDKTCPILAANCLSDSTDVEKRDMERAEEFNRLLAEREERLHEDDDLDEEVDKKLMEYINRRKMECRICGEQFSRSYLVKSHIASEHMQLCRWVCRDCDFGCWAKYQCVNHAVSEHKWRNIESAGNNGVRLQTKEEYFFNNPLVSQNLLDPNRPDTPEDEEEVNHENGVNVDEEAKSDREEDDGPPEVIDLEDEEGEVSFKQNGTPTPESSPETLSPPNSEAGSKRKRGRPRKADKQENSYNVKRTRKGSGPQHDNNDNNSIKMVFSKVGMSSSVSPSESRESSVSKESDTSHSSDLDTKTNSKLRSTPVQNTGRRTRR